MPTSRTRRVLLAAAAAVGVAAGAAGIAGAATGGDSTAATTDADEHEAQYTSSITAPEGPESQSEADETAALHDLATVTADQARAAALAAVPGTAAEPELEDENGNVVWGVEVTAADGSVTDVKVDAGNGQILDQEAEDGHDDGESHDEGEEGAEVSD